MTLIAASILVDRNDRVSAAVERARAAAEAGASLVEWRIDRLADEPEPAPAAVRLVAESPLPCIVTCRPTWEGGFHQGGEHTRFALLETLVRADTPPRYVDVELAAAVLQPALVQGLAESMEGAGASLILSSHDHGGRPADLLQRLESLTLHPAASVVKLAWQARSLRDNLEAFDLLAARSGPMIALCMGEFGLPSRVLAGKFGALLTFAQVDDDDEATADGQPTIDELRSLYRFDAIGPSTSVYGVIGWPVAHSRSPEIHNAGFAAVGHDGVYLPLPVPPEYEHFKATVGALLDHAGLGFRGASVTIPHKEHLLRFVRERGGGVDEASERVGAANTLVVSDGGTLEARNTDVAAAVESIAGAIGRDAIAGTRAAVLGAGGVARAVAGGLALAGASVTVLNRTAERARRLADEIGVGAADALEPGYDIVVNCTSVGMASGDAADEIPLGATRALGPDVTVMDTVYTPTETPFIIEARSRGARVVTGDEMFERQASAQFEAWTGTTLR